MPKSQSSPTFLLMVLVLVGAALVLVGQLRSRPSVPLPEPLPKVEVQGWLNTEKPITSEDLAGKWVVIDMWATWCPPCIASMPELAAFRERWEDRGVVVLGLAVDDATAIPELKRVIESTPGFTWPVAYGCREAMESYDIAGFPTLAMHDPSGNEVFFQAGTGALPQLEKMLEDIFAGDVAE